MRKQLLSSEDAVQAKCQHTSPCSDCPWARTALNGWLGGLTSKEWVQIAHSDSQIECHTLIGAQCAGAAIYRANVVKKSRFPEVLQLPRDTQNVFATPMEFIEHHSKSPMEHS